MALQTSTSKRLLLIDGLRGIAAVSVVLYHLCKATHDTPVYAIAAWFIDPMIRFGFLGVQIFFVISGFVIAYSLRNADVSLGFIGRFILRRSVRLDPPYWAAILLAIGVSWTATRFFHAAHYPLPTFLRLASHALYLQNITRQGDIVVVFWTLCIEVQFYLLYAMILWAIRFIARYSRYPATTLRLWVIVPMSLFSLVLAASGFSSHGWCTEFWYMFGLGVLLFYQTHHRIRWPAPIFLVAVLVAAISRGQATCFAAFLTGLAIFIAENLHGLESWLRQKAFQYFGRISYSLYLTHTIVIPPIINFATRHSVQNPFVSLFIFILTLGLTCGVAHGFYLLIERPSLRLASRIGKKPAVESSAATPPVTPCLIVESVMAEISAK